MIIAIDFDGCIAVERYPKIGPPIKGSKGTINRLYDEGHTIIIWTCRSGALQEEAIAWLNQQGYKWHHFNSSVPERIEFYGYDSRKIGCDIMIDDRCLLSKVMCGEQVNWEIINDFLEVYLHE